MKDDLIMSTEVINVIEYLLERLYLNTGADCVLLIDSSGQLIGYKGGLVNVNLTNLAALVAGDMAAVTEMARLIGEQNRFKLLFHEGESQNILISGVSANLLLATIFNTSVQIGLVRLYTREMVNRLQNLIGQYEASERGKTKIVDHEFTSSLAEELERAFGE